MKRCAIAAAVLAAACGRAPPRAEPPTPSGLTIALTPRPARGDVLVEITVGGDVAGSVRELRMPDAWADVHGPDAVDALEVADAHGPIPIGDGVLDGTDRVLALGRTPVAPLGVRYRARAAKEDAASRFALRVETGKVAGVGYAFLLLPRIDEPTPARVRWHLDALGAGARGESPLGPDDAEGAATSHDLEHGLWMAGPLVEAKAAGRRAVSLGESGALPGALLEAAARAGERAAKVFGATDDDPPTVLLVPVRGLGRDHDGAHLYRSIGLWLDGSRSLDAGVELLVAHEVVHRWIGERVRLVAADGRDAAWFTEGFTAHYARRVLQDEGRLDTDALVGDLARATTADAGESGEGAARGAMWAAALDATMRAKRGGRSLDDLVAALLARAAKEGRYLYPESVFRELVVAELGQAGGDAMDHAVVLADRPVDVPDGAFGPCVKRVVEDVEEAVPAVDPARFGIPGKAVAPAPRKRRVSRWVASGRCP